MQVLSEWSSPDDEQDRLRVEFLAHLAAHADGTWRECAPGHITASAVVFDSTGTRVLLTLHSKLKSWLQMGGHCEPGDTTLAEAALREATEESGIPGLLLLDGPTAVDRHLVPCHPGGSYHYDVEYTAIAPPDAREQISDESDDLRWFALHDLPEPPDGALTRLIGHSVSRLPALQYDPAP
jgi:8-oxo-dGTP pyrophosphatase MutT (NUDIX family)